jgi:cytochrome c oxidase subunit I+III
VKPQRPEASVDALPTVTFGPRSLMWWGTLGFMTIEGWTLALLMACYFYVRQNFEAWPPLRTPLPSLLIPTINLTIMLLSFIPARLAQQAGKRLDRPGVKRWLVVLSLFCVTTVVLRWWELWALNTRWDSNAYGTATWMIVGVHATLLLLDVADTLGLTLFYYLKHMPVKSFSDVSDNSFYWYFTVGIWIPIYLILYVGPRIF